MTYAKLENSKIVYLKLPFFVNGAWCYTKNDSLIRQAGYKELVTTAQPTDNKRYVLGDYIETDTQIITTWIEKPYTEEELYQRYEMLCQSYIAEKYDHNEENKVIREYLAQGEVKKAQFDKYNEYVESCKTRAYNEVYSSQL